MTFLIADDRSGSPPSATASAGELKAVKEDSKKAQTAGRVREVAKKGGSVALTEIRRFMLSR
jgi:hypothetical protein